MPHILIVCTANICRSPVAEALIRSRLENMGLNKSSGWTVSSAGTWAIKQRNPAFFSIELMEDKGLDISSKMATMVNRAAMAQADVILCMTTGHLEALGAEYPKQRHKLKMMSELSGRRYNISDPYGKPKEEYEIMVAEIERLVDAGIPTLIDWVSANTLQPA